MSRLTENIEIEFYLFTGLKYEANIKQLMFNNFIQNQHHKLATSVEWMGARLKRSEDLHNNSSHAIADILKFFFAFFFLFISQAGRLADLDRLISEQIHFIEKVRNMVNVVFYYLFENHFLNQCIQ